MIKPNWDIFRAKFSGHTQDSFEWFCYLLFCNEFNRPYGIFRYKNQSAIETDPIEEEKDILGWQAKFYETPLSSHKDELLNTIIKSKRDYPRISKLYIFTNQQWGQNKGQKPQGLLEIDRTAEELNIELEWRTASYFESEFVSSKNNHISKYFFTNDKSIVELSEELYEHTCNILENIQTYFIFNDSKIEIDRSDLLNKLIDDSQQISIISGVGGVGKTVLIKKYFEQVHNIIPFYVFKATEFDIRHIDDLFHNFSFNEFVSAFKDKKDKVIVIDSSEKLLDLKNTNAFQEFLTIMLRDNWKIIFTTRDNYLENLNYHFFEIYNIAPSNLSISKLEIDELQALSESNSFSLPSDAKLKELLRNPFYLNEFLKLYNESTNLNYLEFKNKLWDKKIRINKPERERCFKKIAFERANSGQFFIIPDCPSNIIDDELLRDGILGYEGAGYFITHDIYEEWALEKIIESEFLKRENEEDFFDEIGQSLPIRRSFRNWLSEKLLLDDCDIKQFIESIIENSDIAVFWKDELMVSVLLSNYSKTFFEIFAKELLADDQELLKRISFILQLTCKEVDADFFKQLGIKKTDLLTLKYVFTKPKGQGWGRLIEFVYRNIDLIGVQNIHFILPIIHDWNNKMKSGDTTRFSSLIALKFYKWIIKEDKYYSQDNTKENVFQTILYGSNEVKEELEEIFSEILDKGWKSHRDPYYDFSKYILTKIDGLHICKVLPEYIINLADFFWTFTPKGEKYYHSSIEIEQYFGLEEHHSDYHPASALQTPVYWLLKFDFKRTIDFILNFTNKAIDCYVKSGFDSTVEEVKVQIDQDTSITQYVSHCLWNMYRGTGSPVSPYLLQSIHMALEKYLLEIADHLKTEILESWLKYLLMKSNSSSITSVVTSIVLANPDKTFNVAKILFQTKEFIMQDTSRLVSEHEAKSLYSIGKNWGVNLNEPFDNERIKTCEDKHRKLNLENIFLNYQLFRSEEISEEESQNRIDTLWNILDEYYKQIPNESEQNDQDRTWRIFLARMDKRKMEISTKETDKGLAIQFNPELDDNLRQYSESSSEKITKKMKYSSLKLWAKYKFENNDEYKKYTKYEKNPKLALKEVKEIIKKIKKIDAPKTFSFQFSDNEDFYLMNYSIPPIVCSLLIRDHRGEISQKNKDFCRDLILEVSASAIRPNYQYQVSDGVQSTILVLPILFDEYPEKRGDIKLILLFCLFKGFSVGGMISTEKFNIFSIISIREFWEKSFDNAQSLLFAFLLLKPRYDVLRDQIRIESYKSGNHGINEADIMEIFLSENEVDIQKMIDNNLDFECLNNIDEINSSILVVALKIIPNRTKDKYHKIIVQNIVNSFSEKLLSKEKEDKIEYTDKHDFLKFYSYFLLNSNVDEIRNYIEPFLKGFNSSESIADLFNEIIRAEDILDTYDNFWFVWNEFKEKMITLCVDGDGYWYIDKIIKSYLFAQIYWKETAKDWHSFKESNKRFFKNIADRLGHCPSTLYSISKLLNDIGSDFLNDGVFWISSIISNNDNYRGKKLESNTIYYIENLIRKYIYLNSDKIKKTISIKNRIIIILNFLTEHGSVIGYMLRESIV